MDSITIKAPLETVILNEDFCKSCGAKFNASGGCGKDDPLPFLPAECLNEGGYCDRLLQAGKFEDPCPPPNCTACALQFQKNGGCPYLQKGENIPSFIIPQGCPQTCQAAGEKICGINCAACALQFQKNVGCPFLLNGTQVPPSKIPQNCPQTCQAAGEKICGIDCTACAVQFQKNGGCPFVLNRTNVPSSKIPQGCQTCQAAREDICYSEYTMVIVYTVQLVAKDYKNATDIYMQAKKNLNLLEQDEYKLDYLQLLKSTAKQQLVPNEYFNLISTQILDISPVSIVPLTARPTPLPTVQAGFPTPKPTSAPSTSSPSSEPIIKPTKRPSQSPTPMPIIQAGFPTPRPTGNPTPAPTKAPSSSPTVAFRVQVSFNVSQTLTGLSVEMFQVSYHIISYHIFISTFLKVTIQVTFHPVNNLHAKDDYEINVLAVRKSTAKVMGISDYNNIVIIYPPKPKPTPAPTKAGLTRHTVAFRAQVKALSFSNFFYFMRTRDKRVSTLEAQCQVNYIVKMVLGEGNSYSSPESAFNASTKSLEKAVVSGSFLTTLKEAAAAVGSETLACTTGSAKPTASSFVSAVIATPSPTSKPTMSPTTKPVSTSIDQTAVIGGSVGGSIGGVVFLCAVYYAYTKFRNSLKIMDDLRAASAQAPQNLEPVVVNG